ncbi:huntingtin interacting protein K [Echinococcus multilocularis]|uniref:Huntingtin interacting protein K n=1 Tax=Echinococcus multilocularis TaxID=6211 RepID=A0A068Y4N7_ECHMU|nr:huntingtin interacting protein K [Echinococcus multilocularis]
MPIMDSTPEEKSKKPATHAERNAADLEKMTGDFEETEVTAGMTDALKKVTEEKEFSAPAPRIKIRSEDVDLIVQEFEISWIAAEKKLKECHGDVREALCALCK